MKRFRIPVMIILFACMGCAHAVSEKLRSEADPGITFAMLMQSPETFIGKTVIFGGTIVETRNYEEGSEIEVMQNELDYSDYPADNDQSSGRFIFFHAGFLEPEIYANGRKVTGAGKVTGIREGKVGEQTYKFPVIEALELKLWEERYLYDPYYDYPYYWGAYPYWGHPFYHNYSYGYPYWWPPRRH